MIVHCMNITFCVSIHLPMYLFLINSKGDFFEVVLGEVTFSLIYLNEVR